MADGSTCTKPVGQCKRHDLNSRTIVLQTERDRLYAQMEETAQKPYSYGVSKKLENLIRKRLRNELPFSEVKNMSIDQHTEFTAMFGSSSFAMACDYDNQYTQRFFSYGKCGYVAYELHKLTGKPFVFFTDTTSDHGWSGHVGVRLDDNTILDVTGHHKHDDVIRKYSLKQFTVHTANEEAFLQLMRKTDGPFYSPKEQLEQAAVQKIAQDLKHDFIDTYNTPTGRPTP